MSAIVTGGAGGLGGATSRRLIQLGFSVVIFEPDAERAASLADELGPRAFAACGDQGRDSDVRNAIAVAQRLGKLILNVNAAGVAISTPPTATADGVAHDMGLFRDMLDMHLMGPFNVSRLCAAAFAGNEPDADGQRGVIINTSSTAAFDGQAGQTAYASAKAAIAGMTLAMARDLAAIGVRVCAIAPGPFLTPRLAAAPADVQASLVQNVAFPKRFGRGEEFAELVVAILRTTFLNGQTIRIDGAMSTPLTPLHLPAQR
ncbi:MAG TPA: SDR family NAD(P)-dependent oxidoreductase [Sphingobium sp.]|uniref:SDR family NAD(P)-dependent oxidoreductase n=1 Tax=Sphingobium sp. TaxID=1912891 RepID=UPI002ED11141